MMEMPVKSRNQVQGRKSARNAEMRSLQQKKRDPEAGKDAGAPRKNAGIRPDTAEKTPEAETETEIMNIGTAAGPDPDPERRARRREIKIIKRQKSFSRAFPLTRKREMENHLTEKQESPAGRSERAVRSVKRTADGTPGPVVQRIGLLKTRQLPGR